MKTRQPLSGDLVLFPFDFKDLIFPVEVRCINILHCLKVHLGGGILHCKLEVTLSVTVGFAGEL